MRMNLNDLNQLLDLLLIHEGAIISFSEENVEYLKKETEIKVYTAETDDVSLDRIQKIKDELNRQIDLSAGDFRHRLFLIEINPEHQLLIKELQDFFEGEQDQTLRWGARKNSQIASLKITVVFSR